MKVLVLNAPYGNGHKYCSHAICDALKLKNVEVVELDYYQEFCNEKIIDVSKKIHKNSFTWFGKQAYKVGYATSNKFFMPQISAKSAIGKKAFEKYLIENGFNKVIITFPIAAIIELSKKHQNVDFYEIVTDFSLHKKWQNPHLKAIFLGSEDLKNKYPNLNNTIVSGIPTKDFELNEKKIRIFKGKDKKTISIILGASGAISSKLEFIDKISSKFHINIICGTNKTLYKKLNLKYEDCKHINVWGFITDVENLYTASDLVITKSGGMTCAELIKFKTKAIFFVPQYGQERDNALFFEKYNLGLIIDYKNSLNRQINFVMSLDAKFEQVSIENSKEIIIKKVLEDEN